MKNESIPDNKIIDDNKVHKCLIKKLSYELIDIFKAMISGHGAADRFPNIMALLRQLTITSSSLILSRFDMTC